MSHAGTIIGISDLEVERVDRDSNITVYARPTKRPPCIHCNHDGVRSAINLCKTTAYVGPSPAPAKSHLPW